MDINDYNQSSDNDRLKLVFGTNTEDDWPEVSDDTLDIYYDFLDDNFNGDFTLTGSETLGYFQWEERHMFAGKDSDYEDMKKQKGSVDDHYKFIDLEPHDEASIGILTNVKRISDGKRFTIPLHDLSFVNSSDQHSEMLDDYSSWMTNYWYG